MYIIGIYYPQSLSINYFYENQTTPCPEKKSLEYFRHNFIKYWPIFEILSLVQSAENLQLSYR